MKILYLNDLYYKIRDALRGYNERDLHSAFGKVGRENKPGAIIELTRREFKALCYYNQECNLPTGRYKVENINYEVRDEDIIPE